MEANFSGLVRIEKGTNNIKPQLNVRYQVKKSDGVKYEIASIPCNEEPGDEVLYLTFDFKVKEGFTGRLETMYESPDVAADSYDGSDSREKERPIRLLDGAGIIDVSRNESAFVPGRKAAILLDGRRPIITGLVVSGKTAYSTTTDYYFKAGEIINFIFTADKPIRADGTPKLIYSIRKTSGGVSDTIDAANTTFIYQRPNTSFGMVFSLNTDDIPNFSNSYGELFGVGLVQGAGRIVDEVGNDIVAGTVTMSYLSDSGINVYIKTSAPAAPVTKLNGTSPISTPMLYNEPPTLSIDDPADEPWSVTKQYSLNDGSIWRDFPIAQSEDPAWTTAEGAAEGTLKILNGEWNLKTRYVDRAGNQGAEYVQAISVNKDFPILESVGVAEPAGTYISGNKLNFTLNFAEIVEVANNDEVTITLRHRDNVEGEDNEQILQTSTPVSTAANSISFTWNNVAGKEMKNGNGLYIAEINLIGLKDRFGNTGKKSVDSDFSNNLITMPAESNYTVNNLPVGILVDGISPQVSERAPVRGGVSNDNKTITLTFSESVMRGSGIITVRPAAGYAIPPVFEDSGYWLGSGGTRYSAPGAETTYIPSFKEIFDKVNNDQKTALAGGTNFSILPTNARTGQSAGPYKKMTHGLVSGNGYSGNYSGTNVTSGTNAPDISSGNSYMVPDTATKWVLDYQYGINENVEAVNNIRAALTAAKFRWQEIDAGSVDITNNAVTITLNEPLLKGLDWEVYYPAGAFTDLAGNAAAAQGNLTTSVSDYTFQSSGVQAPVIRVNRRSFDARNSNWASTDRTYQVPNSTEGWAANNFTDFTVAGDSNNDKGWGITDFNTVHYRVESETPGAVISAKEYRGEAANQGAVTAAWTGNVRTNTLNNITTELNNRAWNLNNNDNGTEGEWVMPNLVRRSTGNGATSYTVDTKNGTETRTFKGTLRMFRSYNKDLNENELKAASANAALNNGQGILEFDALEASKSYIIGTAFAGGRDVGGNLDTATGYEGVFRTVIALNFTGGQTNAAQYNFMLVEGSNIKNGIPSIAGFPVRDAEETGDNRFVKAFYRDDNCRYWASTEIVSEWYFLYWNTGGHLYNNGEVNNYLTSGYGDLTYAYNLTR